MRHPLESSIVSHDWAWPPVLTDGLTLDSTMRALTEGDFTHIRDVLPRVVWEPIGTAGITMANSPVYTMVNPAMFGSLAMAMLVVIYCDDCGRSQPFWRHGKSMLYACHYTINPEPLGLDGHYDELDMVGCLPEDSSSDDGLVLHLECDLELELEDVLFLEVTAQSTPGEDDSATSHGVEVATTRISPGLETLPWRCGQDPLYN